MRLLMMVIGVMLINKFPTIWANGYIFNVTKVKKCPTSREEWDASSARMKCNKTQGYHCVPNKFLTSLIEFCYIHGYRLPFEKGNCLELAADGILNHVPCDKTFESGCPDSFYFSNELYKYPNCLNINSTLRCFNADKTCPESRLSTTMEDLTTPKTNIEKEVIQKDGSDTNAFIIPVITCVLIIIIGIASFLFYRYRRQRRFEDSVYVSVKGVDLMDVNVKEIEEQDITTGTEEVKGSSTTATTEDKEFGIMSDEIGDKIEDKVNEDIEAAASRNEKMENKLLEDFHMACRTGKNFRILFENIKQKRQLNFIDKDGWNALHHAASGSTLKNFKDLLFTRFNESPESDFVLDFRAITNEGSTILHIAAERGSIEICEYILKSKQLNTIAESKDRNGMNAAHCASMAGQKGVIKLLLNLGYHTIVTEKTKYGENIVLFACIGKSLEMCEFIAREEKIKYLLHAKNNEGWNAVQYAAKAGNIDVLKFLIDKQKVDGMNTSETKKNCLHTACEKGHIDACEYILTKLPKIKDLTDQKNFHAGHFAAKSGKTDILDLLISNGVKVDGSSNSGINILHIACRYARLKMSTHIADIYPDLIEGVTEKGWNVALFIGERGGAEDERINILKSISEIAKVKKRKFDMYHVSRSGKTILFNACSNRSTELVKYLVENYPDLKNIQKCMDLIEAAGESKQIIKLLA